MVESVYTSLIHVHLIFTFGHSCVFPVAEAFIRVDKFVELR